MSERPAQVIMQARIVKLRESPNKHLPLYEGSFVLERFHYITLGKGRYAEI